MADWSPLSRDGENVPLDGLVELGQVDADHHHGAVLGLVLVSQVNLRWSIVDNSSLAEKLTKSDRAEA